MTDLDNWKQVAEKNPIILFEQGWLSLTEDTAEIAAVYKTAARKDPINAVRLIGNIADKAFAKDVLVEAVRTFSEAAKTYPQWREVFKDKPEVVNAVDSAARYSRFWRGDNGANCFAL